MVERQPDDASARNNLAMLYQMAGDARALPLAEEAYRLEPGNPLIADTLGWVLAEQGDPAKGLLYLREAQSRRSGFADVEYHIAIALWKLGRREDAVAALRALLRGHPRFADRDAASALLKRLESESVAVSASPSPTDRGQ